MNEQLTQAAIALAERDGVTVASAASQVIAAGVTALNLVIQRQSEAPKPTEETKDDSQE